MTALQLVGMSVARAMRIAIRQGYMSVSWIIPCLQAISLPHPPSNIRVYPYPNPLSAVKDLGVEITQNQALFFEFSSYFGIAQMPAIKTY
jgi:hypothetical protein